jgi:hypothetical protein
MERKDEMMGRFRETLKNPMLIFALACIPIAIAAALLLPAVT